MKNLIAKQQTMSSREIAEIIGKRHGDVMRDIRTGDIPYTEDIYLDNKNRKQTEYFINREYAEVRWLNDFNGLRVCAERERGALSTIEQLLNVKLIRQYAVGPYKIDGYNEVNNVAYEIDEPQHYVDSELRQGCKDRQAYIENKLGCKIVRIKV